MSTIGALEVKNLDKKFPIGDATLHVLNGINLRIPAGEFVAIVGSSGCGKSTLLRAIVGLDLGYTGDILLDGVKIGKPTLQRAVVFQEHRLFPWMTAEQNIRLGLIKSKMSNAEQTKSVKEHLELVGLSTFAKAYPSQLSGGMSQRVAIARALVNSPKILLLDEPLGALDALTRGRLQDELRRIVDSEGITALLVTHDVEEAIYLADRIVVMRSSPGRISDVIEVPKTMKRSRIDPEFIGMRESILGLLGQHAHEHH